MLTKENDVQFFQRRSQGAMPPKFSEHIVILRFERRYPKQISVIRLKSNISPQNFWTAYAIECFKAKCESKTSLTNNLRCSIDSYTRFSSGRVAGEGVIGGLEISYGQQQFHVVLLATHQARSEK